MTKLEVLSIMESKEEDYSFKKLSYEKLIEFTEILIKMYKELKEKIGREGKT